MASICLTNVGKHQLAKLDVNTPIISIRDKYSSAAVIPNHKNRRVLNLCFFASDYMPSVKEEDCLTKEDVSNIIQFIKLAVSENKDKIYIQCGEGRIRSFTLARCIKEVHQYTDEGIAELKDINIEYSNKESAIKLGTEDRNTARLLFEFVTKLNKEYLEKTKDE